jgi:hypothetical protein
LWLGNLSAAAHYTGMLLDHSRQHSLRHWAAFGSRFQSVLLLRGGDLDTGLRLPDGGENVQLNLSFPFLIGLGELAKALADSGRVAEGLAVLDAGIDQSEPGWLTPELLRVKGELLLLQSPSAVTETAENLFRQTIDATRRQGMLSWELRASTSLARLLRDQDRSAEALTILQPVYDRFTEGFDTADLKSAKALLDALGQTGSETTPGAAGLTPVGTRRGASPASAIRGPK